MTLSQVLLVLRARWLFALCIWAAVVLMVGVVTLLLPKRYTASAAVVLDVKSPDPIAGVVLPGMIVSGYMATQADVLRSERVAMRALQALDLFDHPDQRARWRRETQGVGDFRSWLAQSVLADMEVKPARDSNVITVGYTSPDPAFAAAVANAFVSAYTDITLDLRVDPAKRYNSFFDERAKELRESLEKAQAKLSAYQRQKGILVSDEKLDVENARLAELSSQLVALQAEATQSANRQREARRNPGQMQEVLSNPLLSGLVGDLSRQESKLSELRQRLGDRHPEVVQLQASITNLRARVQAETRRVVGSLTVNDSVNQARLGSVRQALEQQRVKLLRLKGERDEAAVLQRDVENAQKAYDAVLARVAQTSTESQNTQTNVSVLQSATPPASPSWPRTRLNLAAGAVLGVLLAVGIAIMRELRDQRLRSFEDVVVLLKQPLLGVMPAARSRGGLLGHSRAKLTRVRVLNSLPRPRAEGA
ncbi:MAG TPA: chain length determinant protein EpsF [Burkholderiaceae bacterium]|nr:chain length determinant protein EpsF [Burkholderiaceae bacterium]